MKRHWLIAIALPFFAAVLSQWLLGCAGILYPVKHATPDGIDIIYDDANDGRYRLPDAKVREIDARWAAVLECIPPEDRCRNTPPQVQIRGGNCDTFMSRGDRIRGETVWGQRVAVPGSLGALGHEFAHLVACDGSTKCGDRVDSEFRKKYPPNVCEGDKR